MHRLIMRAGVVVGLFLLIFIGWWFLFRTEEKAPFYADQQIQFQENFQDAIDRGIIFLKNRQEPNGEFLLSICDSTQPENCSIAHSATITGGVPLMLRAISDPRLDDVKTRALSFVRSQMEGTPDQKHAAWNLFAKNDLRYGRIPPDIDDTAIMSLLLSLYGQEFPNDIDGLRRFTNEGGLYHNWVSEEWNRSEKDRHRFAGGTEEQFSDPAYFGVDCMVNSDVLGYLSLRKQDTSQSCTYLNDVIQKKLYPACTFYYRNPFMLFSSMTFAAKDFGASCLEPSLPVIRDEVLAMRRQDGSWSANTFNNITAALIMVKLDPSSSVTKSAVEAVLKAQQSDGGWENAPLFPDLANPVFYGSRDVITATALNVLAEYQRYQEAHGR